MSDRNGNVGPGPIVYEARYETLALTDALPPELRLMIKFAPFNYAMRKWSDNWAASAQLETPKQVAVRWAGKMARDRRKAVLSLYGPEHPQAHA